MKEKKTKDLEPKKTKKPRKQKEIKCCGVREDGGWWYESAKMESYKWYNSDGMWFYKGPYGNVWIEKTKNEGLEKVAQKIRKQGDRDETKRQTIRADIDRESI